MYCMYTVNPCYAPTIHMYPGKCYVMHCLHLVLVQEFSNAYDRFELLIYVYYPIKNIS